MYVFAYLMCYIYLVHDIIYIHTYAISMHLLDYLLYTIIILGAF